MDASFRIKLELTNPFLYSLAMDEKYILGIPEIDAQHEEISEFVDALRTVISHKDQRHLVHQALKRLHQTLVTHFDYEEEFMRMLNYPELQQHKRTHKGMLKLFEDYFDHPPAPSDIEYFGKLVSDKMLGHIMEHDLKMAEAVRRHLPKKGPKSKPGYK